MITGPDERRRGLADAYLRIDDFPSTGYEFIQRGGANDTARARRLKAVMRATVPHGVVPEFMVCTHVIDRAGRVFGIDEVYPMTIRLMRRLVDDGQAVVNAHGMFHVREKLFLEQGVLDAREFLGLDEKETARRLDAVCEFMLRVFGKSPRGFVAPAWGYEPDITKRVAARYFDYIADSYDSWQRGETLAFGTVDPLHGYVHFPETWRYGPHSLERNHPQLWAAAMRARTPIHLMQHGSRIPGEWRRILERGLVQVYGERAAQVALGAVVPRARRDALKLLAIGAGLVGAGATAMMFGAHLIPRPLGIAVAAGLIGALAGPPAARLSTVLQTIRDIRRASLAGVLDGAARAGVRWGTLDDLAKQIKTSSYPSGEAASRPQAERPSTT